MQPWAARGWDACDDAVLYVTPVTRQNVSQLQWCTHSQADGANAPGAPSPSGRDAVPGLEGGGGYAADRQGAHPLVALALRLACGAGLAVVGA